LNTLGIDHFAKRNALYDHIQSLKQGTNQSDNTSFRREMQRGKLIAKMKDEHLRVLSMDQMAKHDVMLNQLEHLQIVNESTSNTTMPESTTENTTGNSMRNTNSNTMGNTTDNTTSGTPQRIPQSVGGTTELLEVPNLYQPWSSTFSSLGFGDGSDDDEQSDKVSNSKSEPVKALEAMDTTATEENLFLEIEEELNSNHNVTQNRIPQLFQDCEYLNFTEIQRVPDHEHLVDFPVIYQGANLHSRMFCLMIPHHVAALNALYTEWTVDRTKICPQRTMSTVLQDFACCLETEKVNHGWVLGTAPNTLKVPFNALVRMRLNLLKDEVVDIGRIVVSGTIGHVNDQGLAWVMSDVQMKVMEESSGTNMVSNIISLEMCNVVNTSIQNRRDCSYMVHDPKESHMEWQKGQRVSFGLKISTRSNLKDRKRIKPCFVQAWNPQFMS